MKKISIICFYGYKNIGDGAIFDSALRIINQSIKNNSIDVHTSTRFKKNADNISKVILNPYGIAIVTKKGPLSNIKKIFRFVKVISLSMFYTYIGKLYPKIIPTHGDFQYIKSIRTSDIIIGIGGGYLRTKSKYQDYFGLILTLLPIHIAHVFGKKILFLPMSYGNFASKTHDNLTFNTIKNDVIIFRDTKSSKEFNKHKNGNKNSFIFPDLALLDSSSLKKSKSNKKYIVLTARLWMNKTKQERYEKDLARFVDFIWEKYKITTVFIPMVWNKEEEDDKRVAIRIFQNIRNKNSFKITSVTKVDEVKRILINADVSICTRMHSAILSTIVRVPFITISYEYKTIGLLEHLNLTKWNIDIENFSYVKLQMMFDKIIKNKASFLENLNQRHDSIKNNQYKLISLIGKFES